MKTLKSLSCLLVVSLTLFASAPCHANLNEFASITDWATQAAEETAKVAMTYSATRVFLEEIKAAPQQEGGTGSRLMIALEASLKQVKLTVTRQDFQILVKGRFKLSQVQEGNEKKTAIEVTLIFEDTNGEKLLSKTLYIQGEAAVPALAALNKNIPPQSSPADREEIIKSPKSDVSLAGSKIKTVATSPYAVEILVKDGGRYVPRRATIGAPSAPPADKTGRPFVDIKGEEVYAIRLYNDSPHDAAVHLTIDGLSVFAFSEIKEQPMYWIVPAKSHIDVLGWKITEADTDEFKSVEFPRSAAAEKGLSHDAKIGVITALFSAAWESPEQMPEDEGKNSKGTGRGSRIKDETTVVQRFVGKVRDSISVRYERELPAS
jgi:hypothetical protein